MSYAFSYYGADTVDSFAEGSINPFAEGAFPTDAAIKRIVGPLAGTDHIGAVVKGIGGYLKVVYKVDNFSSIPDRLGDLVRRAA
jgi:hypothetical protein